MDLFDVFIEFDIDFQLTVKHNSNKVIVAFLPLINGKPHDKITPFVVTWMKDEATNVEEVRLKVREALNRTATNIGSIDKDLKDFLKQIENAASSKKSKSSSSKPEPKKPEPNPDTVKASVYNKECSRIIVQKKTDASKLVLDEIKKSRDNVNLFLKEPGKCDADVLKRLQNNYKEVNEIVDELEPTLF